MCDKIDFELCRLCLNSGGFLINILDDNNKLEIMLEKTIEDLLDVKVVEEAGCPWLVCGNCMEKLTEFRLFKRRCAECLFVFYNRIQKGCNPATKDWINDSLETKSEEEGAVPSSDEHPEDAEPPGEELDHGTSANVWAISSAVDAVDDSVQLASTEMEGTFSDLGTRGDSTASNGAKTRMCKREKMEDEEPEINEIPASTEEVDHNIQIQEEASLERELKIKRESNDVTNHRDEDIANCQVVTRAASILQDSGIPSLNNVQITIKRETSDGEDQEAVEMPTRLKDMDHNMDNHEGYSIKTIVKIEEMDVEEQEAVEIPASQGSMDQNVGIQEGTSLETKPEEEGAVPSSDEHPEDAEPPGEELDHGTSANVWAISSAVDAVDDSVQLASTEMEGTFSDLGTRGDSTASNGAKTRDDSECIELHWSSDEEVNRKEEFDADKLHEERHLREKELLSQDGGQKLGGPVEDTAGTVLHVCQICNKVFAKSDLLKDHVMHAHLDKVIHFRCQICSELFARKNDLARHIKLLHAMKNKYQCEFCSRNFHHLSKFKAHILSHTGERPFKCALCLKDFARKLHLQNHVNLHTGERPHRCQMCSKAFAQSGGLKMHLLTHAGERPHRCKICAKAFTLKGTLKRHLLTHTDERSYMCRICSKAFTLKGTLETHVLTHTGERSHKCQICYKAFTHSSTLKRHLLTHTGERPNKCPDRSKNIYLE